MIRRTSLFFSLSVVSVVMVAGELGCKRSRGQQCTPQGFESACSSSDIHGCRVSAVLRKDRNREGSDKDGFAAVLANELDGNSADLDSGLRRLFDLEQQEFVDTEPVFSGTFVFTRTGFSSFPVTSPIDWRADPDRSETFRFWFQNLSWLSVFGSGEGFSHSLESGAAVVLSFSRDVLRTSPSLDMTWNDHALALRLQRVSKFVKRYAANPGPLSRPVLVAAARIIISHLHALTSPRCYTPLHNHGAAQDVAILETLKQFPSIAGAAKMRELAIKRLLVQIEAAISSDGMHLENSPGYQVYFAELVTRGAATISGVDGELAIRLEAARDSLLNGLAHMLQPNHTFPQFGETENRNYRRQLDRLLEWTDAEGRDANPSVERLRWIVSRGAVGIAPSDLGKVFSEGGFAAVRSEWSANAIAVHMTCGYRSDVHYQPDEGSFEIQGFGRELVVDSGVFTYGRGRFADYQNHPRGQNVLVVNGKSYSPKSPPLLRRLPESVDGGFAASCEHNHYTGEGISTQKRTLRFKTDGRTTIVDAVTADRPVQLSQYVTLHPDLDEVRIGSDNQVTARMGKGGPSLTITPSGAVAVSQVRGHDDGKTPVAGFWFDRINQAKPATRLQFDYGKERGEIAMTLEITVAP